MFQLCSVYLITFSIMSIGLFCFIPTACAAGIDGFILLLCSRTALRLRFLESINNLQSLSLFHILFHEKDYFGQYRSKHHFPSGSTERNSSVDHENVKSQCLVQVDSIVSFSIPVTRPSPQIKRGLLGYLNLPDMISEVFVLHNQVLKLPVHYQHIKFQHSLENCHHFPHKKQLMESAQCSLHHAIYFSLKFRIFLSYRSNSHVSSSCGTRFRADSHSGYVILDLFFFENLDIFVIQK